MTPTKKPIPPPPSNGDGDLLAWAAAQSPVAPGAPVVAPVVPDVADVATADVVPEPEPVPTPPAAVQPFHPLGVTLFGDAIKPHAPLANKFVVPPFSVLDARSGDWQDRKAGWLSLGIESEVGRSNDPQNEGNVHRGTLAAVSAGTSPEILARFGYKKVGTLVDPPGRIGGDQAAALGRLNTVLARNGGRPMTTTSIFDPVLTECVYRWFAPVGGQIVDPFAGGSVRGIVATMLPDYDLSYWGCELRAEQIAANEEQVARICTGRRPVYVQGDAFDSLAHAPRADLVFTCPPYGDLERYSEDPQDLSTMEYPEFIRTLGAILEKACALVTEDGYAVIVVGEFRDRTSGNYHGFVTDTVALFRACGFALYNDAILVTAVGTLPIRASYQFDRGRKLGKTHQNVLVFRRE